MKIGKHFTLEELTVTDTGIANIPNDVQRVNLRNLVTAVLDPVRDILKAPIKVNSGFRSKAVNSKVGGSATSQHLTGEAADLDCYDNAELFAIIRENTEFDQLIWEGGNDAFPAWVHVSYKTQGNRNEVLKMTKKNGKSIYTRL